MLREFFEVNMLIVLFGYGLVFFLLGFAITLQARHESRFTLARSLPLLGTFGLLHGIAEWGHVFIPIQSLYLSEPIIMVLRGLATTLLSLAFVALFSLARASSRTRRAGIGGSRGCPACCSPFGSAASSSCGS